MNQQQGMGVGGQQPMAGGPHSAYPSGGQAMGSMHGQSQQQPPTNPMYAQDQAAGSMAVSQQAMLSGQHSQHHHQQQPQQAPSSYSSSHHQQMNQPAPHLQQSHLAGSHHSSSSRYGASSQHHGAQHGSHRASSLSQQQQQQQHAHHYPGSSSHHRAASNMLHQHRSSAAAISDPMMASGITEHLASAGGPLTGSGGALNQIGQAPYGAYGGAAEPLLAMGSASYRPPGPVGGGSSWDAAGFDSSASASAPPVPLDGHHSHQSSQQHMPHLHQSRYDAHYSSSSAAARRHQSQHGLGATDGAAFANPSLGYQSHSQPPYGSAGGGQYPLDYVAGSGIGGRSHPPPAPLPPSMGLGLGGYGAGLGPQMASGVYGPPAPGVGGLELTELRARLQELQVSYANVKRELEMVTQKLGSSMHSIKSFWSPELKKERALRKEEQTKYALINDQMKMMRVEVQKQALLIRQLEDELRLAHETSRIRTTDPEIQQHLDALCLEKENLFKENCLLRDTIRELEMRIETQKQTLAARDDSIRKMVEMMNNKGLATKVMEDERLEVERVKTRNIELEARLRHYETIIVNKEKESIKQPKPAGEQQLDARPDCMSPLPSSRPLQQQVPKSPVPKQRKSLLINPSATRQSKVERLKSRLANSKPNQEASANSSQQQQQQAGPTKEQLNEMMLKSSNTSVSLSSTGSSSGVSSSKSNENSATENMGQSRAACLQQDANSTASAREEATAAEAAGQSGDQQDLLAAQLQQIEDYERDYKLCQCHECQTSGQEIYSRAQKPTANGANNQQQQAKKMVSFLPKVEHIGSPSYRLLNDNFQQLIRPQTQMGLANGSERASSSMEDTCDSLHATKDFSLAQGSLDGGQQQGFDEDYLRPLDCSTPIAPGPDNQPDSSASRGPSQEVLEAEVHFQGPKRPQLISTQPPAANPNYICLCAPNFMCSHNYPQLLQFQQRQMSAGLRSASNSLGDDLLAPRNSTTRSDFPLSSDCIDCKNLSTYVNLSPQINSSGARLNTSNPASQISREPARAIVPEQDSRLEYKRELMRRQLQLVAHPASTGAATTTDNLANRQANMSLEESMHYLSEARRLSETLASCGLCSEQLARSNSSLLHDSLRGQAHAAPRPDTVREPAEPECNCPLGGTSRQPPAIVSPKRAQEASDNSLATRSGDVSNSSQRSSRSYHTASSSLPPGPAARAAPGEPSLVEADYQLMPRQWAQQPADRLHDLSVLPLANGSYHRDVAQHQQQSFKGKHNLSVASTRNSAATTQTPPATRLGAPLANPQSNQMDSSLSSLFVYRHLSDNDAEPGAELAAAVVNDDYCDGLFLHQLERSIDPDSLEVQNSSASKQQRPRRPQPSTGANWLKPRPRSDYIPLSSLATGAGRQPELHVLKPATKFQVDSDLSKSSIVKRRQLNISQQQQQQQSGSKKKLPTSKQNSRSSPNVSQDQSTSHTSKTSGKSAQNRLTSSSNHSNVKSIYQCVKNHLLDITSSSKSSNSSALQQSSASLPARNNNNKQQQQQFASLPRNLPSKQTTGKRNTNSSKATQMEELRSELTRRDQELLTMGAKMKALEDQQRDSQRHILVLKDSLVAKEEHYNLLLADREELRRNLDERNRLIDRRSYQQTFIGGPGGQSASGALKAGSLQQELGEMQSLLEMRDKRIGELQRKLIQLENLLAEREAHLERTRMRLEHSLAGAQSGGQPGGGGAGGYQDVALLNHLEETLGDKEKQICLLRDQRDRAEHELQEERDSHERSIKEYKMKLSSFKFEMDKLQSRASKTEAGRFGESFAVPSDRFGQHQDLIKRLELDKRALQLECERLKDKLETSSLLGAGAGTGAQQRRLGAERASSALGDYSVVEFERLQEALEGQKQELRRAQAENRMNEMERKRASEEADKLSERCERISSEMHKLKAKLENTTGERDQILEDYERQQQMLSRAQAERDGALADVNQAKLDNERLQQNYNKIQLECERHLQDKELQSQQGSMYKERLEQQQQQLAKLVKDKEQLALELEEARERVHKLQKQQENSEHETRNEVRIWKDKYERLLLQYEKLNEEILGKQKECQMMMEKLQRNQSDNVKLEAKLEQCEMDKERLAIELEKCQQASQRAREEQKKWSEELHQLQEMYTKTNTKLLNLTEIEERLRIDYEKCQMDLEVLRERYEKLQLECRKMQQERDRLQLEHQRLRFDQEAQAQHQQQLAGSKVGQAQQAAASAQQQQQLAHELERSAAKLEQCQREINKLQLEKERLILDSKAAIQQVEQQHQQQLLKAKSNEEKLLMELERGRMQLDKVQSKCEQTNVDQEKLLADKERLQQQLLLLQQEVDKFRSQQSNSAQETKRLHDEEMQRVLQELETIRDKYTQQRKELLQLRELQQSHELDKDILKRELEAAESRLDKFQQQEAKQRQDSERCLIEIEKLKDKLERKQQELARTQKERDQFAQEIQLLHKQIQQLQIQFEQQQQQQKQPQQAGQTPDQQQQVKPEEINKLKQMLVKSENDLQKTMAENQRLQMEVERLKLQLDDAGEYIGKIENDNKMIARQNADLLEQMKIQAAKSNQQQQQQQSANKQDQAAKQQKELELAHQEMKKMQEVIKKSSLEIQKIHDEKQKLAEANKQIQQALEQTKAEFRATIEQYENELDRIQKENQQQQQQQKQQQQQPQQQQGPSDEYKIKFEKAVEAIKAFQKTTEDMKRELFEMNKRNKTLSEQNQSLNETLRAAEENLKRAQAAAAGAQKQAQRQQSAEGAANNNQQENQKDIQEMRQQVTKLSELCGQLERELDKAQEENRKQLGSNQQLKQAMDKTQAEFSNLKSERDRYQAQLEKLIVELERREDEMANLQTQQDKSGQNLQAKQTELQNYQRQLEEREKALEAKRQELANLSKQVQLQQQQQQSAGVGNNQAQQEMIAKLQVQVKNLEEERAKLRGELERVRNELKQAQAELERLLKILSASEEEKFNLTQQIDQLQAKLKAMPPPQQNQPPTPQQQQQQAQGQAPPPPQQQQQTRGPPPPPGQQQGPRQPAPGQQRPPQQQQQQRPPNPQQQQQQQKPAQQAQQRQSGAGAFISGFFQ